MPAVLTIIEACDLPVITLDKNADLNEFYQSGVDTIVGSITGGVTSVEWTVLGVVESSSLPGTLNTFVDTSYNIFVLDYTISGPGGTFNIEPPPGGTNLLTFANPSYFVFPDLWDSGSGSEYYFRTQLTAYNDCGSTSAILWLREPPGGS